MSKFYVDYFRVLRTARLIFRPPTSGVEPAPALKNRSHFENYEMF